MTIDATTTTRRRVNRGALLLLAASFLALSLAGVTARRALAATSSHYLTSARSIELLRQAYGSFAERPLRETQVVVAPTSAATWALSDKVNMANGAWNPRNARPWATSDAKAMWPNGMDGFTNPATGTIYIDGATAVESVMPHELLHANSSPEFLQAVGVGLNEGITEQLALDALAAGGVRAEKVPTYANERALAAAVVQRTGRDLLLRAYFNGGSALAEFVAAVGPDAMGSIRQAGGRGDVGAALSILATTSATTPSPATSAL